ncbi:MAG: hypothetical protein H6765_01085 [Candidatus Peribacteria bacterium]|nr:MAG: hypothetical protein H6765_01085 [Candidatus Peribacteria bacterium]
MKKLVGNRLKYVLDKQTNTSRKALWTGTWVTGLVQSSGLVTLILLAFVGAGAMMLQNAI